uniref:HCO3_cotransp domain-containing protein n=1 Tax=Heterorhabditis bacteriophora TaxID=37862 RepID=A0A1I7WH59_HETBA
MNISSIPTIKEWFAVSKGNFYREISESEKSIFQLVSIVCLIGNIIPRSAAIMYAVGLV